MEPRPDVIVDFLFEDGMLLVAVQNIGLHPAPRVPVAFAPPFQGLGGEVSIPELPLFGNIEFLAPSALSAHFWIPAPRISPARSPGRSSLRPLIPIGRGKNSRADAP